MQSIRETKRRFPFEISRQKASLKDKKNQKIVMFIFER